MTRHFFNCCRIVWGQGNASLAISLPSSCYITPRGSLSETSILHSQNQKRIRESMNEVKARAPAKQYSYMKMTKTWSLWSTSSPLSRSILTVLYCPLIAALCRGNLDACFKNRSFNHWIDPSLYLPNTGLSVTSLEATLSSEPINRGQRRTGREGEGGLQLPQILGNSDFLGSKRKFGQSQFLKTSACLLNYFEDLNINLKSA